MTDFALCLEVLYPAQVLGYRDASSYARLVETWDATDGPVPSEADLLAAETTVDRARLAAAISVEAERRKDAGTYLGGVLFKTDDQSLTRLHGMLTAAERYEATNGPGTYSQKFRTAGGIEVTVAAAAEVATLYDGASAWVGFILDRSATLQAQALAGTLPPDFDPTDSAHWQ